MRFWRKKKVSASSHSHSSQSSPPIPAANPPRLISTTISSDQSTRDYDAAMVAAKSVSSPAGQQVDDNPRGVSRTDAWLARATLFLKVTKEVSEATGLLAPLKAACGATITLLEAVQAVRSNGQAWNELLSSIRRHQDMFMGSLDRNNMDDTALESNHSLNTAIQEYQRAIADLLAHVFMAAAVTEAEIKANKTTIELLARRIGTAQLEASTIMEHRRRLTEAKEGIVLSFQVYVAKWVHDMQENDIIKELRITGLEYGSHVGECMERTRQNILNQVHKWSIDMDAPNILWIKGHPGVGKSAIATSLVKQLRVSARLGSHFFFQRQKATEMTPKALWLTVAYDLAQTYPAVRRCIVAKFKAKHIDLATANVEDLFNNLIHEPLVASEGIPAEHSPVVVIDALDECGGLAGQRSDHRRRLMWTLERWSQLPTKFKLLVTSRGESDVRRVFSRIKHYPIDITAGSMVDPQSSTDVRVFLEHQFKQIEEEYETLPSDWPGSEIIQRLTNKAGGLFIWARTIVSFIGQETPKKRLDEVLSGKGVGNVGTLDGTEVGHMGALYSQILVALFHQQSSDKLKAFRSLVGAVIVANAPLTVSSITQLLSIEEEMVTHICRGLQSVMEHHHVLRFNHQSLVDFLLDHSVCPREFQVDLERANSELGLRCLTVMTTELKFNICNLESSYLLNTEIQDLEGCVRQRISGALQYSCIHWSSHLCFHWDPDSVVISGLLDKFLTGEWLLYWLEALSLIGKVPVGVSTLRRIKACMNKSQEYTRCLVEDALRFMLAFFTPISTSAPHVYVSALPFAPTESHLWKHNGNVFPNLLNVCKGRTQSWPALPVEWRGHTGRVNAIAYSPDGRHVVSGSEDKTLRIWDAETGVTVGEPLRGHTDGVFSVAYSPDGRYIVSGSGDKTLRIWDAETGVVAGEPLRGHADGVRSVSYSIDGRRIVSASSDTTLRIWDAETGVMACEPMVGHSRSVRSIAHSPDGKQVVSGSDDNTLRFWDTRTGEMVGKPLTGHKGSVLSVAYSPDGRQVVSASYDKTLRIWDTETGAAVGAPLMGHVGLLFSVAYSHDGRYLVSASYDKTVRIWDVETRVAICKPLMGHVGSVRSVAYSPDDQHIVSGGDDSALRIWDAKTGAMAGEPLMEHMGSVLSAAYSPDGRYVVSGCSDKTLRIWDVKTGMAVGEPLTGHTGMVLSVAYSPDGRHFVSGSDDKTVRIWDAQTGVAVSHPLTGHTGMVWSVAYSPDGRCIVSASTDETLRIWDAATGVAVGAPMTGSDSSLLSVAYSPDGRHIATGSDSAPRIWDAKTGAAVSKSLIGHKGSTRSVAYSWDGRHIVSGSFDSTLRIWDVEKGAGVGQPLIGHMKAVRSVAYSPDGRHIVSGSDDMTLRLWDAKTGMAVGEPWVGHSGPVCRVAYSPDGRYVVSGSEDKALRIWDAKLEDYERDGRNPDSASLSFMTAFTGRNLRAEMLDSNGWVRDNKGLLFWVPEDCRHGLTCPTVLTIPPTGPRRCVRIDFTQFRHGRSWTEVTGRPTREGGS